MSIASPHTHMPVAPPHTHKNIAPQHPHVTPFALSSSPCNAAINPSTFLYLCVCAFVASLQLRSSCFSFFFIFSLSFSLFFSLLFFFTHQKRSSLQFYALIDTNFTLSRAREISRCATHLRAESKKMTTEIRQPPSDWITKVAYAPLETKNLLASTSWDKHFRLHDIDSNTLTCLYQVPHPLLDCAFAGEVSKVALAGVDNTVNLLDISSGVCTPIGSHDQPVRNVCYHDGTKLVYTGGWDNRVRAWDIRARPLRPVCECILSGKCYSMDISASHLVVADSMKRVYIYDFANQNPIYALQKPSIRDNVLKFQMRCIRCFPDYKGFAVSSIEGRVAWEYFDMAVQGDKYTFKCHRNKESDGVEKVYPVNALSFHPLYGTFATGGSDGGVAVWDGRSRRRLWRLPNFAEGISGATFNPTGNQLALAVSYSFEEGPKEGVQPPKLIIKTLNQADVMPKPRASEAEAH